MIAIIAAPTQGRAPAQAAAATSNSPGTTENAKARLPPVKASTIFVTVLVAERRQHRVDGLRCGHLLRGHQG
jgi:hypothetical protein